ncbi:MAG: hypothetical protein JWN14_4995 [Chthonomonadales bacterium]|nr:hypothetical protein [Chthonomonadales bacterium]
MSTRHNEIPESISKVQQVRQAANVMGISERTVYRRLRSGKLEQLPSEIPFTDNVMTLVSETTMAEQISVQISPRMDKLARQIDMTNDNLSALRQELANRDAQIQMLLENQKELTATIQKLHAQIFELARLALIQPAKTEEKPAEVSLTIDSPSLKRKGGLMGWLRSLGQRGEGR